MWIRSLFLHCNVVHMCIPRLHNQCCTSKRDVIPSNHTTIYDINSNLLILAVSLVHPPGAHPPGQASMWTFEYQNVAEEHVDLLEEHEKK
jgi:hypothetical protein